MKSAHDASKIHEKRTGRPLHITEEIVAKEEMYEEVDDHMPPSYHPGNRYAAFPPGSLRDRIAANHSIQAYRRENAPSSVMMNPQLDNDFEQHFGQIMRQHAAHSGPQATVVPDSGHPATQYSQGANGLGSSRNPRLSIPIPPAYPGLAQQQSPQMDTMWQLTPGPLSASSQHSYGYGTVLSPAGSQAGSQCSYQPPRLARTDSMQSNQSFGAMVGNALSSPAFVVPSAEAHASGHRSNSMPFNNVATVNAQQSHPMDRTFGSHEGPLESSPGGSASDAQGHRFHSRHNSDGSIQSPSREHELQAMFLQSVQALRAAQQQSPPGPGYPFLSDARMHPGSQAPKRRLPTTPGTEYGPAKHIRADSSGQTMDPVTALLTGNASSQQPPPSTMARPQRFDLDQQSRDDTLRLQAVIRGRANASQARAATVHGTPVAKHESPRDPRPDDNEATPTNQNVGKARIKSETVEDESTSRTGHSAASSSNFDNVTFPFNVGISEANYFNDETAVGGLFPDVDGSDVGPDNFDNFSWDDFLDMPSSQQNS